MTNAEESPSCPEDNATVAAKKGAHRLAVRVHERCVGACVLGQGSLPSICHCQNILTARATGMCLSGEWRMFLHAADLTVVFYATVTYVTELNFTTIRTHEYFMHSFTHLFFLLPEQEDEHTHTPHDTTLRWPVPHKHILSSHVRNLLFVSAELTLGEHCHWTDCV